MKSWFFLIKGSKWQEWSEQNAYGSQCLSPPLFESHRADPGEKVWQFTYWRLVVSLDTPVSSIVPELTASTQVKESLLIPFFEFDISELNFRVFFSYQSFTLWWNAHYTNCYQQPVYLHVCYLKKWLVIFSNWWASTYIYSMYLYFFSIQEQPQARMMAVQYAKTVFSTDHIPSRYVLLLASGDR